MTTEPFSRWFRKHVKLDYHRFMRELDDRQKMKKLLTPNSTRLSAKKKLKSRKGSNLIVKHRSKTRIGRLKGLL